MVLASWIFKLFPLGHGGRAGNEIGPAGRAQFSELLAPWRLKARAPSDGGLGALEREIYPGNRS